MSTQEVFLLSKIKTFALATLPLRVACMESLSLAKKMLLKAGLKYHWAESDTFSRFLKAQISKRAGAWAVGGV